MIPSAAKKLLHRVTLQRSTEAVDDYGQAVKSWTDVGSYYASVHPLSGRELQFASQQKAQVTHRIVMRHRGILPTDRLVHGGKTYNISSVRNDESRNVWIEILAEEVV